MYTRTIPLIKLWSFRKRKILIAHHHMLNSIYMCILSHVCKKLPERAWKNKTNIQLSKILAICYFGKLWTCPDMLIYTTQNWNNQLVTFIDIWLYAHNWDNHSSLYRGIGNVLFGSFLVIPRYVWQHLTKMTKLICSFCWYLALCKISRIWLNSFQRYWQCVILKHFGHAGS